MGFFKKIVEFFTEEDNSKYKSRSGEVSNLEEQDTDIEHTMQIKVETPDHEYIIKKDGEYLVFKSKEDMPADVLALLEDMEHKEEGDVSEQCTVIADGKCKRYSDKSKLPKDIQDIL
jgi:predicted ribosome-associated RNA-binding protein Tma20